MKAYVELVQRKEREEGCDVLTHQRWSGADYVDNLLKTVTGGHSSTAAMGSGVTEGSGAILQHACCRLTRLTGAIRRKALRSQLFGILLHVHSGQMEIDCIDFTRDLQTFKQLASEIVFFPRESSRQQ
jgi:hypothetical protein